MDHALKQNSDSMAVDMISGGQVVDVMTGGHVKSDAVVLSKAVKSYGRGSKAIHVLKKIDMTVEEGKVYSLLGASGCGKTTVLSCIVGDRHLDSGHVRIFGLTPNTAECGVPGTVVGFMPQGKGLSPIMTITEIIYYFGRIYGMSKSDIEMRLTFLLQLLQLPPKRRHIHTLSGGQQKRLSFAIALLHEPRLLILDEPTVGADPILRQMMWKHLRQITAENKTTVILSTQYIEEARQAHVVGLMRNGRLLAQEEPSTLMRQYGAKKLEDVFLTLCVNDDEDIPTNNRPDLQPLELEKKAETEVTVVSRTSRHPKTRLSTGSFMNHTEAMLRKNFTRFWRDWRSTSTIMNLGPIMVFLTCFTIGPNPRKINMAVVNHEWPHDPICQPYDHCLYRNLSCKYLHGLDKNMVNLVPYYDESAAEFAAKNGDVAGVISFPANYSDSVTERLLLGNNMDNTTLLSSISMLRMDTINYHVSLIIQRHLLLKYSDFMQGLLSACDMNPVMGVPIMNFGEPIYGIDDTVFTAFSAPAFLVNAIYAIGMMSSVANIMWEREDGMVQRIVIAGVHYWELILARLMTQMVLSIYASVCMILVVYFTLGFSFYSSAPWLFLLCILHGTCASMLGIFIGVTVSTTLIALFISVALLFTSHIVSAVIWPLQSVSFMPVKLLCYMNPNTFVNEAARSMFTRGLTIYNTTVWQGYASVIVWFIILVLLTMIFMRVFRKNFSM